MDIDPAIKGQFRTLVGRRICSVCGQTTSKTKYTKCRTCQAEPDIVRFLNKIEINETECWIWQGAKKTSGYAYGHFHWNNQQNGAHRFSYEFWRAPIPEGLEIDHLCRNPPCVNPDHLEAVTHGTNTLRGISPWAENARKTHCKRGHLFSPANTRYTKRGGRHCRICDRDQKRFSRGSKLHVPSEEYP